MYRHAGTLDQVSDTNLTLTLPLLIYSVNMVLQTDMFALSTPSKLQYEFIQEQ